MNSSLGFELFQQNEAVRFVTDVNLILQIVFANDFENGTVFNIRTLEEICQPGNEIQQTFQLALVPAVIILLLFSFTQRRQSFLVDVCNGRPAFAYPMDIFTRNSRLSYACAFGSTVYVVYKVVFERFYAFPIGSALYERPLATVASTLIYGTVYIPIFICITIGTVHGYGVGSLYMWALTGSEMSSFITCDINIRDRTILAAKRLPEIVCLLYLCIRLPWKFVTSCRERHFIVGSMELLETSDSFLTVKKTYYGKRVTKLLQKPKKDSNPEQTSCFSKFFSVFYKWEPDFQFSSRIITTQLVGAMLLYQIAFEVVAFAVSLFNMWFNSLRSRLQLAEAAHLVDPTNTTQRVIDVIHVSLDALKIFRVLTYTSFIGAFVLGLFSILASFPSYRRYLGAIFKGDYSKLLKSGRPVPNQNHLAGCMRYAGFQVGYISWGFIIQSFVFVVISFFLTIVILVFMCKGTSWFVDLLEVGWPIALTGLIINFSQLLSARYLFLQDRGNTLALTNRRFFFIATYFMFFYNIFMGVFSCLLRVLESLIFGLYLLPRLDHCILPPSFRAIDPGYQSFIGFLMTESQHCHPIVLAFVHMMEIQKASRQRQQEKPSLLVNGSNTVHVGNGDGSHIQMIYCSSDEEDKRRRNAVARFQWHLAYTLLNNSSVRLLRKGYMQAEEKAKDLGLMLPVSDSLHTNDVDKIREQTGSYLAQQEAEKEKNRRRFFRQEKNKVRNGESVTLDKREGNAAVTEEPQQSDTGVAEKFTVLELPADVEQGQNKEQNITERQTYTNPILK
ncbi:hypothetical protein RRG08_048168 [Elysia crispata]|uniref:Receptor for retinol uptake STRA6 n=1 Tax=Elysia crispata TaxID=231223 RepID=A0AAE0ZI96_9GAST|nr:hypothetical protein RRG08_048168 [Elysia crispata]